MRRERVLVTLTVLGILFLVFLASEPGYAATYTASMIFDTEDQSMWGSGDAILWYFLEFYGVEWGPSTIGPVGGYILGTGGEVSGTTSGKVGFEVSADFDGGSVDVTYPVGVEFSYADTANPGGVVTISSSFVVEPGWSMSTNSPEANLSVDLIFDVFASISGKVCLLGDCESVTVPLINVERSLNLVDISSGDLEYSVPLGPLPGAITAYVPDINTHIDITTGGLVGKSLVSSGEDDILDVDVDLDAVATMLLRAAGVPVPDLAGSISLLGILDVGYDLLDLKMGADFVLTQDFEFLPSLMVELTVQETNVSLGFFEVGTTFDVDLPDDVDDPNLVPTFFLDGGDNFSNDLGLRIDPEMTLSVLSGNLSVLGVGVFDIEPAWQQEWTTEGPAIPLFGLDFELQGFDPSEEDPFDLNYPPIADAGPDQVVEQDHYQGAFVTLDGSGSSDVDGDPLTYSWSWAGGTATGMNPVVNLPLGGPHTITLIVNDELVDSEPDTVDITVVDTTPPVLVVLESITVEQETLDGTVVPLPADAEDICDADVDIASDELPIYPLGETVVTFTATDDSGNVTEDTTLVIVEDTTPPDVVLFEPNPSILWVPNHKFVTVNIGGTASDICDLALDIDFRVEIIDAEDGDGGKKHDPDVIKVDSTIDASGDIWITVQLRAERSGLGDGRTYVITAELTDDSGNTGEASAEVFVPHDQEGR